MSEWTSLSCKADTKERVKEHQAEDEGQDDVLNRALDALGDESKTTGWSPEDGAGYIPTEERANDERIDELLELMKDMDVVSRNQQVIKRIDDLETELKTHLERELRQ